MPGSRRPGLDDVPPPCESCKGTKIPAKVFFCSEDCAQEYRVVWSIDPMPDADDGFEKVGPG